MFVFPQIYRDVAIFESMYDILLSISIPDNAHIYISPQAQWRNDVRDA